MMAGEATKLVEVVEAAWTIRLELRALPRYWLLTLTGHSTPARNKRLRQLFQAHLWELTTPSGAFYPLIVDMHSEGVPTLEGMYGGMELVREFAPRMRHIVIVMDPTSRRGRFLEATLPTLERIAGHKFQVAPSVEAAIARLDGAGRDL